MSDWINIQKMARRRLVFVTGYERYFTPRIRRWWMEASPSRRVVDLFEPTVDEALSHLRKGFIEQPINLILRKMDLPEKGDLARLMEPMLPLHSSVLIYLSSSVELSGTDESWLRKHRSGRFGYITLSRVRWYDRRKKVWAGDILRQHGLVMDDRGRDYLLDWCRWDMGEVETQVTRLSLLFDPGSVIPASAAQKYLPQENFIKGVARLVRMKNDGYFTSLEASLFNASDENRRRTLNRHLNLLDQIRILLLVDRSAEDKDAQYEKMKKISPFPLTRPQFDALLRGPEFTKTDCLDFLSRSCQFLSDHFSGA